MRGREEGERDRGREEKKEEESGEGGRNGWKEERTLPVSLVHLHILTVVILRHYMVAFQCPHSKV